MSRFHCDSNVSDTEACFRSYAIFSRFKNWQSLRWRLGLDNGYGRRSLFAGVICRRCYNLHVSRTKYPRRCGVKSRRRDSAARICGAIESLNAPTDVKEGGIGNSLQYGQELLCLPSVDLNDGRRESL